MRDPSHGRLGPILADALHASGVDITQKPDLTQPLDWSRPPLYSNLEIAGRPLQVFLSCPTKLSLDDLVGAYERFLRLYVGSRSVPGRIDPRAWLKAWVLPDRDSWMMFTPTKFSGCETVDRPGLYKNVVQIAAVAAYSGGDLIASDDKSFLVEIGGCTFGIHKGQIMDASGNTFKATRRFCQPGVPLAVLSRQGPPKFRLSPDIEKLRCLLRQQGLLTPALDIALVAMVWRDTRYPAKEVAKFCNPETQQTQMKMACREASHFREFPRPLPILQEMFVPYLLTRARFRELFGHDTRSTCRVDYGSTVPEKYALRWDAALQELCPGYMHD